MTQTVLISKKVKDVKAGDMLVSYFVKADDDYPEPERIAHVIHYPDSVILYFEDGREHEVMKGMQVIIQDLA